MQVVRLFPAARADGSEGLQLSEIYWEADFNHKTTFHTYC